MKSSNQSAIQKDRESIPQATRPFLNKNDVAQLFGITVRTLDSWQRRQLLPFFKIGKLVRFDEADIREHLRAHCRRG